MLRQAENRIRVEGILSEIDLRYGSYMKNGTNMETVGGTIKVLVEQNINGVDVVLEIPVHMFSTKFTNAGKLNPAYESIERVMNEFVSIAACGSKEKADRIRITNANMRMNEFYGQNGVLVSQPRVSASFVQKAVGDFKPEASFSMEFMLSDLHRVTDNDGVELDPAKLEVTAIVPQYGGKVDVCKLYVTLPNAVSAIENNWETGKCYKVNGRLNFTSTTQTIIEEVDFGEPIEKTRTTNVSEFLITSGSLAPIDEDFAFSIEDIKAAMADRKNRLEELKNRPQAQTKQAPPAAAKGRQDKLDLGF